MGGLTCSDFDVQIPHFRLRRSRCVVLTFKGERHASMPRFRPLPGSPLRQRSLSSGLESSSCGFRDHGRTHAARFRLMTERITPQQFHQSDGVDDWRALFSGARAYFRTGSFATGVALVEAIGTLADAANHHPDVDLRYAGVTVRLMTHDVDALSERDVKLARQISAAARKLNVAADPTAVQTVQVTIDALVRPTVMPFWCAVLGYREVGDQDLIDPFGRGPSFWF